jgi:hypothetical protein
MKKGQKMLHPNYGRNNFHMDENLKKIKKKKVMWQVWISVELVHYI